MKKILILISLSLIYGQDLNQVIKSTDGRKVIKTTGSGASKEEAKTNALISAIEQVKGVSFSRSDLKERNRTVNNSDEEIKQSDKVKQKSILNARHVSVKEIEFKQDGESLLFIGQFSFESDSTIQKRLHKSFDLHIKAYQEFLAKSDFNSAISELLIATIWAYDLESQLLIGKHSYTSSLDLLKKQLVYLKKEFRFRFISFILDDSKKLLMANTKLDFKNKPIEKIRLINLYNKENIRFSSSQSSLIIIDSLKKFGDKKSLQLKVALNIGQIINAQNSEELTYTYNSIEDVIKEEFNLILSPIVEFNKLAFLDSINNILTTPVTKVTVAVNNKDEFSKQESKTSKMLNDSDMAIRSSVKEYQEKKESDNFDEKSVINKEKFIKQNKEIKKVRENILNESLLTFTNTILDIKEPKLTQEIDFSSFLKKSQIDINIETIRLNSDGKLRLFNKNFTKFKKKYSHIIFLFDSNKLLQNIVVQIEDNKYADYFTKQEVTINTKLVSAYIFAQMENEE